MSAIMKWFAIKIVNKRLTKKNKKNGTHFALFLLNSLKMIALLIAFDKSLVKISAQFRFLTVTYAC